MRVAPAARNLGAGLSLLTAAFVPLQVDAQRATIQHLFVELQSLLQFSHSGEHSGTVAMEAAIGAIG